MPDPIFVEPRLAAVYDAFDGERGDLPHYLAIADEFGAKSVLDVGCGTGNLAVLLAGGGRTVTGIDPAAASLEIARSRAGGERVTWIHGDAASVPAIGADLAIMTGNVAQVFLTAADWAATLRGIRGALRPGGRFVFETRRPERRAWEEWVARTETRDGVERRFELLDVTPPYVSFRYTFRFASDGAVLTSDSTLRFRDRAEIEASLTADGFDVLDVREAPDRPGREFVFVAQVASTTTDARSHGRQAAK
ncbi:class I SAM-dependent methyltransferase [Winogradskya humida]|uniref:Methyltransferase n=1 Tax=Winogradskya humida TaxID=113566 RepID=A0ABQ3ZFZ8_9ACTN|nr:class I SAM-dependent methyltransferase [Actinoplanes humidus]GIE17485.1 methyltransferase [Actinoplanes humidus]